MKRIKEVLKAVPARVYIALGGLILGFSVTFAEVGILAWAALAPLAYAILGRRLSSDGKYRIGQAYLDGFLFYMCFDIICLHWFLYFYPLEFLGFTKLQALAVVLLAWIGLSLLQSVFSAFVFVLISLFSRTRLYAKYPVSICVYAAALFAVNEWTQTLTWAGIPWSRISISQTEMPLLMQSASLFGSYFLTFLIVSVNFLLAFALIHIEKRRICAFAALGVFTLNLICGAVLYFVPHTSEDGVLVAAIQGNLPSQDCADMTTYETYLIYERLSLEVADEGAKIIIWPENTVASTLDARVRPSGTGAFVSLRSAISSLACETGATFVVGHFTHEEESGKIYNSISAFYPDGTANYDVYAKIRIVPFGEYVPMRSLIERLLPILGSINFFGDDTTPGESSTSFPSDSADGAFSVSTLICFDSIYEELGLGSVRAGGELFVVPSNDSWFYDSRALNMHHAQNILRAVECGRYTVSAGNTGITSIVSDKGEIVSELPIFSEGYLVETVYPSGYRTLYSYIGNAFVYLCAILALGVLIFDRALSLLGRKK